MNIMAEDLYDQINVYKNSKNLDWRQKIYSIGNFDTKKEYIKTYCSVDLNMNTTDFKETIDDFFNKNDVYFDIITFDLYEAEINFLERSETDADFTVCFWCYIYKCPFEHHPNHKKLLESLEEV